MAFHNGAKPIVTEGLAFCVDYVDHTSYPGSGNTVTDIITGGTGKFAGWTGSGPWACEDLGKYGSSSCRQTLNYTKP